MYRLFRSALVAASIASALPGCGLTLDYDPPEDAGFDAALDGAGLDAPLDGGDCPSCPAGTECFEGSCLTSCTTSDDCTNDAVCEVCDPALGVCIPTDVECAIGCGATCDPVLDACVANCPAGEACVGGMCDPRVACADATECARLPTNACGLPAKCVGGFCVDALVPTCPDYDCGVADACNGCEVTPTSCPDGTVCSDTFACVECTLDADAACVDRTPICDVPSETCRGCASGLECVLRGRGRACTPLGECVECLSDVHCVDPGLPVCDASAQRCVACLRNDDCEGGHVCGSDHVCRPCAIDSECGRGQCVGGVCRARTCTIPTTCPTAPCAGAPACPSGTCTYPLVNDTLCDDGSPCTVDRCQPADIRADGLGCVHERRADRCDDDVSCTVDVCIGARLLGDGCVHRPNHLSCGAPRDCLDFVCAPEGAVVGGSGCFRRFDIEACSPGELCTSSGQCVATSCGDGCANDDVACNGVETCDVDTGDCVQVFDTSATCSGACNELCVDSNACGLIGGVPLDCAP